MGQRPQFTREPDPEQQLLHRLGGLLARWHCWRRHYHTERSYARTTGPADPEDALEEMLMRAIEAEVEGLPVSWQRMAQQLARAECLGVDSEGTTAPEYAAVLDHLRHRLIHAGIL